MGNKNEIEEQKDSAISVIEKSETLEKVETVNEDPNKSKKSKPSLILLITVIVLMIMAILSTIFAIVNMGNDKIVKGVKIAQIDISKMTTEEATKTLEEIYSKKSENEIYLTYEKFETTTTYNALEVKYQINEAIKQAHQIGRNGNLFKDNFNIIKSWTKGIQIDLDVTIDKEMLNQVTQNINNSIEGAVEQPDYYQEGEKIIITSGKPGLKVDENKLYEEIYNLVKADTEEQNITIPFINAEPDKIDIEKIHQETYKQVKDAYSYACIKTKKNLKMKIITNVNKLKTRNKKVLLVSHPYNTYDATIGKPIIDCLESLNCSIVYSDLFDKEMCSIYSKELSKNLYWKYSKEIIGSIELCKDRVDGIIFLSTFPCGLDSLVNDLIIRKLDKKCLNIVVDDMDSFAGLETRLESFVDILV